MDLIRVLGPIEIAVGGFPRPVGGRHPRAVLAALVLGIGHAVPAEHLAAVVWGDDPPSTAHATLQTHVSNLRKCLGPAAIVFEDGAYVLRVPADKVDAVRFERLAIEAADVLPADPAEARRLCMEALGLWRGPPFGDLYDNEYVFLEAHRLDEMRIRTMELRLEADLALGRITHAAGLLEAAVNDHPYRERLWYLYISALAMDGRRVEALRAYRRLCAILGEAGLEPSRDLQQLEQDVLVETPGMRAHLAPTTRAQ